VKLSTLIWDAAKPIEEKTKTNRTNTTGNIIPFFMLKILRSNKYKDVKYGK